MIFFFQNMSNKSKNNIIDNEERIITIRKQVKITSNVFNQD